MLTCYALVTSVPTTATTKSAVCSNCGVYKNSGKVSCCAIGGDWFGDCGNEEGGVFGHTFIEGIEACKSECMTSLIAP